MTRTRTAVNHLDDVIHGEINQGYCRESSELEDCSLGSREPDPGELNGESSQVSDPGSPEAKEDNASPGNKKKVEPVRVFQLTYYVSAYALLVHTLRPRVAILFSSCILISKAFRYADKLDAVLMAVGTVTAMAAGTCNPFLLFYWADTVTAFVYHEIYKNMNGTLAEQLPFKFTPEEVVNLHEFITDGYAVPFTLLATGTAVLSVVSHLAWGTTGQRQAKRIRNEYFHSLLEQNVEWFDVNNTRKIAARYTGDMESISGGLGGNCATFFHWTWFLLVSFSLAFIRSWHLALACLSVLPVMVLVGAGHNKFAYRLTIREKEEYATAGTVASEVFEEIRTVTAFNGQEVECKRYNASLASAEESIVKKGVVEESSVTMYYLLNFVLACVVIAIGVELFFKKNLPPGSFLAVLKLMMTSMTGMTRAVPCLHVLAEAREAASRIYSLIALTAQQEANDGGIELPTISGSLELKDVTFSYPARPDTQVVRGCSFRLAPGQTVALVGHSGCGKSSVIQLLERFYDPQQGTVLLDDADMRSLDARWLRRQIGFVGQEPVLFSTSIEENIRHGNTEASRQDVIHAAVMANAHDFIDKLPKGYETFVGDSGCQLSGGQKQRIAIARALVRNPKILLLDEATSALDSENEATVQRAIEKVQGGRTTLIVAHRLSTVVAADNILVMKQGEIIETGTHPELMARGGYYTQLFKHQIGTSLDEQVVEELQSEDVNMQYGDGNVDMGTSHGEESTVIDKESAPESSSHLKRILLLNAPDRKLNIVGCSLAFVSGFAAPVSAFAITEALTLFGTDEDEARGIVRKIVGIVLGVAAVVFLFRFISSYCLSKAAARLTTALRSQVFRSLVHQDLAFFDEQQNSVGLLTNRLSGDCLAVQGISAMKLGSVITCVSAVLVCVPLVMWCSWKLSLVALLFIPLSVLWAFYTARQVGRHGHTTDTFAVKSGQIIQESLSNIRLVFSLSVEEEFKRNFRANADALFRSSIKASVPTSILMGLSESSNMFMMVAMLTYGSYLVQYENLQPHYVFRVMMVVNYLGIVIGRAISFAPDFGRGRRAAARLLHLMDCKPGVSINQGGKKLKGGISGAIELNDVHFHYGTRPDIPVLRGVTMATAPGQTVALVGTSGCGKTTTTALIERFYDVTSGSVLVDGEDARDLDLRWYRSQLGVVSQEPVLFDRTIGENIQYGDTSREVTMDEVIEAARTANLHGLVQALPQGYDTKVGNKGTQLSGGEKQRIAIARALIRNPTVLLLDEATSALDSHNEKIVQEALWRASEGRTTIVISHRLSTVQHCDLILIFQEGVVVEAGCHDDLIARAGIYYRLLQTQNKQRH